jgi:hypothetical protein
MWQARRVLLRPRVRRCGSSHCPRDDGPLRDELLPVLWRRIALTTRTNDEGDASPTDVTRARVDSNRELRWAPREHPAGRATRPAVVDVSRGHDHCSARGHFGAARNGRGAERRCRAGTAALRRQGHRVVLAHIADSYRSGGLTKSDVRQQLLALYSLYEELRARVQINHVELVDGDVWFYTTGEVIGRLPLVGWVTVLSWQREPEVARRQGKVWRLVGFQD